MVGKSVISLFKGAFKLSCEKPGTFCQFRYIYFVSTIFAINVVSQFTFALLAKKLLTICMVTNNFLRTF